MPRTASFSMLILLTALLAGMASARGDAVSYGGERYQRDLVEAALSRNRLRLEGSPEGKVIERVVIVPFDVILHEEPYPDFLNWFHSTTRPDVVRRELLFREGDRWSGERIEETARNLRGDLFLTSASITAAKGSAPDRVVALVVTKDLWSLRPNTDFSYVGSKLERLDIQLSEHNLLGRMKRVTLDAGLNLASGWVGEQYQDPRVLGSGLALSERADVFWNRSSGALEGGLASLALERPLRTLDTEWAWGGSIQVRKDVYRLFSSGDIAQVQGAGGETLPYAFDRRLIDFSVGLTRSLGHRSKRNLSVGYKAFVHDFELPGTNQPVSAATRSEVSSEILPRSESAGMLFASYHWYLADFRELLDVESFAVTEDFRLGPDVTTEVRYASRAFGFSSSFVEPIVSAAWSGYAGDDLFTVSVGFDSRYQPEAMPGSSWVNTELTFKLRNVSPQLGFIRLHSALSAIRRHNSVDRDFGALGSNNSLRGYPSSYFRGANLWLGNLEARTRPVALATLHFGLAAFLDVGGASDSLSGLGAHGSAGGGLRIGLPQFNRDVLRVDLGVPFERVPGAQSAYLVVQYGQAF